MKPRLPLVIGNWKMNPKTAKSAHTLAKEVVKRTRGANAVVVVAPPFPFIGTTGAVVKGSAVLLGAQEVHAKKEGAYTGGVSVLMLKSMGVRYVIVGHSERRQEGETDAAVNEKVAACLKAGIAPVVCVGERTRDTDGQFYSAVEHQLRAACAGVGRARVRNMVVAYEPVWAVGSGTPASAEEVHEMMLFLRKVLVALYDRACAASVRLLYGGSVTAKNAPLLLAGSETSGLLVGGASIRAADFVALVNAVSHET